MTSTATTPNIVDPAYLQRRTLELGREAVEGRRDLSALLGDAFQELREARASIEALQRALRQRDEAGAVPPPPAAPDPPVEAAAGPDPVVPHRRRTMQVPAIVAEPNAAVSSLFDGPLPGRPEQLAASVRSRIASGLYLGTLRPGDRVPGIREIARRTTISYKVIRRVFQALEREGLIEIRDRSGIYVAAVASPAGHLLEATESWVAEILVEAMERGLGVDALCARIQRWTGRRALRCACLESVEDDRVALVSEVRERFGMEAIALRPDEADLAAKLREVDLVVSTPYSVEAVRKTLGAAPPLVVAQLHPRVLESIRHALVSGSCVMICVDPASGERLLQGLGSEMAAGIRVVGVKEASRHGWLDQCGPGVATLAAWERLGGGDPPAHIRVLPYLGPQSAHTIVSLLIDLNRSGEPVT